MRLLWFIGTALMVLGLATFTPAYAASSEGGTAIGPTSDFTSDPGEAPASTMSGDIAVGDLGKGTEQPMRAPDVEEGGGLDMRHLIVPNQSDYDAARESDIKSMLSF
ncbi:MAG: hypothetical protein GDA67_13680 [Nitrospira sp. CR1.3]|nr:hypothetical protein [Nitrospira sp. CR1.3]